MEVKEGENRAKGRVNKFSIFHAPWGEFGDILMSQPS
jgi:hypothetical protein